MKKKEAQIESYEKSVSDLEEIVSTLEKGDLPLEDQLKAFETGVKLSRDCIKRLESVERKVEKLVKTPSGDLETEPFNPQA